MSNRKLSLALILALLIGTLSLCSKKAQAQSSKQEEAAIRAVLDAQVAAWNKADVPTFMASYEESPETAFVGAATVQKGYATILERYKKNYSTPEQMGTLTFHDLDIRLLPSSSGAVEYAVVIGKFHLERSTHGTAAKDDGIFSLVWHKGPGGWKIILDHTA